MLTGGQLHVTDRDGAMLDDKPLPIIRLCWWSAEDGYAEFADPTSRLEHEQTQAARIYRNEVATLRENPPIEPNSARFGLTHRDEASVLQSFLWAVEKLTWTWIIAYGDYCLDNAGPTVEETRDKFGGKQQAMLDLISSTYLPMGARELGLDDSDQVRASIGAVASEAAVDFENKIQEILDHRDDPDIEIAYTAHSCDEQPNAERFVPRALSQYHQGRARTGTGSRSIGNDLVSKKIDDYLDRTGMQKKDFAGRCKLPEKTIYNVQMTGRGSRSTLSAIALAMGITLESLLNSTP